MISRTHLWSLLTCLIAGGIALADSPHDAQSQASDKPLFTHSVLDVAYQQYSTGPSSEGSGSPAASGYNALKSGLISLELPQANEIQRKEILNKIQDQGASNALFADEKSPWRALVIKKRVEKTVRNYLLYKYYMAFLLAAKSITQAQNEQEQASLQAEFEYVAELIQDAAQRHARKIGAGETLTSSREEIYAALEEEAQSKGRKFDQALWEKYFGQLQPISAQLKTDCNHNKVLEGEKIVYQELYGPKNTQEQSPNGSWLSGSEIKTLAAEAIQDPSDMPGQVKDVSVHALEFTSKPTLEENQLITKEISWLHAELGKNPQEFKTLFFIGFEKEWTSCLISKSGKTITLTLLDPLNKDRHKEKGIALLADAIQDALSPKASPSPNLDPFLGPKGDKKDGAAPQNYNAPLAHLKDDEIPSLQDLFGEKIPNVVNVCIKQMEQDTPKKSAGTKLKNCLLLYGPPGTGKSTIAQVMARAAGRDIVYAGGGDFRDAYQGSGKAKLDALFAEAKRRGNCIILIDEIDGTSSRLQPHGSTQEDTRAIKSLITTLDQYRQDPDIYVICTTNYPENMDPAILRRFKTIEIPLPDYQKRKKIIDYYLKKNEVVVASKTPDAVSPDFYDKLLSATEGFSGDTLGEMINSAVFEFQAGLEPEYRMNLDFRTKGIDFTNKSIFANLGELLLLPLTPLFMMIGESALDKHLYSQYMHQINLRRDLKENERKNDPTDKYAKEPSFFTRVAKRNYDHATTALENSFWQLVMQAGWKKALQAAGISL